MIQIQPASFSAPVVPGPEIPQEDMPCLHPQIQLPRISRGAKFLLAVWGVFVFLIGFGINGGPTPALNDLWSYKPYSGYVLEPLANYAKKKQLSSSSLDDLLMKAPQAIRSDDFLIRFPLALSQLSHSPRFPLINTNYLDGRNMLPEPQYDVPIWHITALARPSSWGYFFLGAQRGVTWQWWFPVFACFTVLYLLLGVVLDWDRKLAAFGSFWFCASAYVVCFGYSPAYAVSFIALAALSAYYLLRSEKRWVQLTCGALLGLAISGFAMILYPPLQVPLAYAFLLILIGLVIRDKLYMSLWRISGSRGMAIAVALLIIAVLMGAYLHSSWADLKVMAATVYPGARRTTGGGYPFWRIFSGVYNLLTSLDGYRAPIDVGAGNFQEVFVNQSEASSFYLLFPALAVPAFLSKRWRRSFGITGWLLAGLLAFMIVFLKSGIPKPLAAITLFDRATGTRVIPAVGLLSIILCLRALQCARTLREGTAGRLEKAIPVIGGAIVIPIFVIPGLFIAHWNSGTPSAQFIAFAALAGGCVSYFILAGKAAPFCACIITAVLPILLLYNQLSTNLDYVYKTELAGQIQRLDALADRPLWICYGAGNGRYTGVLVSTLGGRAISGIQWPPALEFWHRLDPSRQYEDLYNRHAHIYLHYTDDETVSYSSPFVHILEVTIRADNPVLKQMGAKYILATDLAVQQINTSRFPLIYRSQTGNFSIFEIP
jgi:hypothetical protein